LSHVAIAAERPRITVMPFRNSTGKILRLKESDLSKWMSKELQKTRKFEMVGQVQAADYALFGTISGYRIENYILSPPITDESQVPEVFVDFTFRLVDAKNDARYQEFLITENELADPRDNWGGPPYDENDLLLQPVVIRACRQAFRTAAKTL